MLERYEHLQKEAELIQNSMEGLSLKIKAFLSSLYDELKALDFFRSDILHIIENADLDIDSIKELFEELKLASHYRRDVKEKIDLFERKLELTNQLVQPIIKPKTDCNYTFRTKSGADLWSKFSKKGVTSRITMTIANRHSDNPIVDESNSRGQKMVLPNISFENEYQKLLFLLDIDSSISLKLSKSKDFYAIKNGKDVLLVEENLLNVLNYIVREEKHIYVDVNILDEVFSFVAKYFEEDLSLNPVEFNLKHEDNLFKLKVADEEILEHKKLTSILKKIKRLPVILTYTKDMVATMDRAISNFPDISVKVV